MPKIQQLSPHVANLIAALSAITVETLTPIEAMNELYKLKKLLD